MFLLFCFLFLLITNSREDNEPLSSYLGSVCTLRKITLKFTKLPLDGKTGLSDEDHLALFVGELTIIGSRGEPAFRKDVQVKPAFDKDIQVKKGFVRRGGFIDPDDDPAIARWVNGLRTGNGLVHGFVPERGPELNIHSNRHILQMERMQRDRGVELESRGLTASFTPPPTPRALPSRINGKEVRRVPTCSHTSSPMIDAEGFP
jgi:hypothetical protein